VPMACRIVMPSFGMYTVEGTVGRWLRPAGARVEAGEPVVELTTEKASYEVEAPAAGILHPVAAEGAPLTVEGLIGYVLAEGEAPPEDGAGRTPGGAGSGPARAGAAAVGTGSTPAGFEGAPGGVGVALGGAAGSPAGAGSARPALSAAAPGPAAAPGASTPGPRASPLARRLAAERGIDLSTLAGSGPGGRIVEADVLAAEPRRVRERVPFSGMRKAIAERLRRALDTAVPLTLTREVRADVLVEARGRLAERLGGELPYDALFLKLFAAALRERPELNAVVEGDSILLLDEVHLGFAVSLPGGLAVPVVRDAESRPLAEVAAAVLELSARARSGTLKPQDVLGATATLSNLGAYGVDAFTPVLNPPQSVILGVGRIAARPVVEEGALVAGRTCVLSLTFDHRVADGAPAAELLAAVARCMTDATWLGSLA